MTSGPRGIAGVGLQDDQSAALSDRLTAAVAGLRDRPITITDKGFGRLASAGVASAGLASAGVASAGVASVGAASVGIAPGGPTAGGPTPGGPTPGGPTAGGVLTAARLAAERPALFGGGFDMPILVLREAALRQNIESMAAYCAAAGVLHAPHGKTTMAPQLFARQIAAGAWGVTAATVAQAQVYRTFGVPRVLIASQLTERGAAEWLARELAADPDFDGYVYADSLAGVRLLDEAARSIRPGRPLKVLVELGYPGGRTGCRSIADALAVAGAVDSAGTLELAGAAGYEGGIQRDDPQATAAAVAAFCDDLRTLSEQLPGASRGGPFRKIVTAGGSSFFDVVCRELSAVGPGTDTPRVVLRSGAYITHDHGHYAATGPGSRAGAGRPEPVPSPEFAPALELWTAVLSVPEPGLAIVNAGRRDVSCDQGMPVPLRVRPTRPGESGAGEYRPAAGMRVTKLDDQHGYVHIPEASDLWPGDLMSLGITHPCTTFDKWRVIPVVGDDDHVIDAVHTFF
jgi:D-serine deaminase-like pyridoxal phosphate-dependent protein